MAFGKVINANNKTGNLLIKNVSSSDEDASKTAYIEQKTSMRRSVT